MSAPPDGELWPPMPADWTAASRDELHLVRLSLADTGPVIPAEIPELTPDEVRRAERYLVERPRRQFALTRRAVRRLCSRCLGIAPRDVAFEFTQFGKPTVAAAQNPDGLAFNVSHSGEWAVIALGWRRTLGVDIETVDHRTDFHGLAKRFFSPSEQQQLFALPEALQQAGFYRVWTGKEAYLKATGLGMSFPLGDFTVAADPRQPPRLLEVASQPQEPARWTAAAFTPARDVFGTLLWDHGPATIHHWTWSSE